MLEASQHFVQPALLAVNESEVPAGVIFLAIAPSISQQIWTLVEDPLSKIILFNSRRFEIIISMQLLDCWVCADNVNK